MLRRCLSFEALLFLALWLGLLVVGRTALFRDPGTFWHVVLGRQILAAGAVPWTDVFSFTCEGRTSLADQWLAECVMAAVHRMAGWDGLLLLTATILAAVYAWIGGRLYRRGLHPMPVVLVLAVVLLASSHNFHVRPLVATIALEGVCFAMLLDVEAGRARLNRLVWLVPLFVLWTNLHGGVLGGLGTLGLASAGWCVARVAGLPSPVRDRRDALGLAAIVVASALSVLVSPYGAALPRAWLQTMSLPLPELIEEHGRLDLAEVHGWVSLLLAAFYGAALLGAVGWGGRGWPRAAWLVPLVWFVLACQRVRNLPLFALTAALALADVLPSSRMGRWLQSRDLFRAPDPSRDPSRGARGLSHLALPAICVAAAFALQAAGVRLPVVGSAWVRFDPARWPVELIEPLGRLSEESPDGTPVFNDLNLGGFVIYYAPRLRVFIDDRCALYGEERLRAYDEARLEDPAQLQAWQARYGFGHALVRAGTKLDRYLDDAEHWRLAARDEAGALYERVGHSESVSSD